MFYRLAADAVLIAHFAYVLFVVCGLLSVLVGYIRKWKWVHNGWFRCIHLAMILIVVVEAWLGITCPLTTWEKQLRLAAGDATYSGDFVANFVHNALFINADPAAFTVAYSLFGAMVLLALFLVPPRFSRTRRQSS